MDDEDKKLDDSDENAAVEGGEGSEEVSSGEENKQDGEDDDKPKEIPAHVLRRRAAARRKKLITIISIILIVLLSAIGAGAYFVMSGKSKEFRQQLKIPKEFASEFETFEIFDPPGMFPADIDLYDSLDRRWGMGDFGNKFRLINFWATWCTPCRKEISTLLKLQSLKKDDKNFEVIFISMDYPQDAEALRQLMKHKGIPSFNTYYMKDMQIWDKIGLAVLPTSMVIGPRGHVLYQMVGDADWSSEYSLEFFERIME